MSGTLPPKYNHCIGTVNFGKDLESQKHCNFSVFTSNFDDFTLLVNGKVFL